MAPKRRERWYSLDGQRRIHQSALESNSGPRRLISLIVLLILVLMMIRQVSDSKKVGRVAGAIGLLPTNNSQSNPASNPATTQSANSAESLSKTETSTDALPLQWYSDVESLGLVSPDSTVEQRAQVIEHLMQSLSTDGKVSLVEQIFGIVDRSKSGPSTEPNPTKDAVSVGPVSNGAIESWLVSSTASLSRWIGLADSQTNQHALLTELHSSFEAWSQNASAKSIADLPEGLQRSVRLAMDRALLSDLADNTPWKTTERLSLARLLVRASEIAKSFQEGIYINAVPTIAVPQLLSQTDTLRGRCYRLQGTIGRIDQPSSMELADSKKLSYRVLWLKPIDLSDQPINIFIPDGVSPEGVSIDGELKEGDTVEVAGLIAKRRAYASERGGEIAPVLIATCMVVEPKLSTTSGPLDANRVTRSLAVSKDLARLRNRPTWAPPIDRQAPMDLVQQALAKHLDKLHSSSEPSDLDKLVSNPSIIASLANLVKFQNEIDTIVSGGNIAMVAPERTLDAPPLRYQPLIGSWHGFVVNIQQQRLDPKAFPGLDWPEVHLLQLVTDQENPTFVLVKGVPERWLSNSKIHQPAVIQGLGLLRLPEGQAATAPSNHLPSLILASNVAWQIPTNEASTNITLEGLAPKLSLGQTQLLQGGWDLSQCDTLERLHGQSLTSKEARAFYTLLEKSVFSKNEYSQEQSSSDKPLKVLDWIRRTEAIKSAKLGSSVNSMHSEESSAMRSVGEWVEARVQVRRIQRVDVRDVQHQAWLGANHYYQLDGVADIGPTRINVKYGANYEPITYERDFPITLVASQLPSWILSDPTTLGSTDASNQEKSDLDSSSSIAWSTKIRVDVAGYAYRIWRFRTPEVSAATKGTGYQQAPMMVVDRWQIARGPVATSIAPTSPQTSLPSIITTILGIAAICWFAYRMTKQSRR